MELTKRPCFIFYKMVESLVWGIDDVLVQYRYVQNIRGRWIQMRLAPIPATICRRELLNCEERTFKQDRPRQEDDVRQTRQLHLMQQELGIMRQHLFPAERLDYHCNLRNILESLAALTKCL